MRETRIGRVVFGVPAPLTGGLSRWNILADVELSSTLPEVFAPPPEIVPGFTHEQVEAAMAKRTPITWEFIRARNIFGGEHIKDSSRPFYVELYARLAPLSAELAGCVCTSTSW